MDSIFKFEKREEYSKIKYFIFSVFFLMAFFALLSFSGKGVKAATTITVTGSNYTGNVNDKKAVADPSSHGRWFVQGTGVEDKDVISFTVATSGITFDRIAVVEENHGSDSGKDYDTYILSGDSWTSGNTAAGCVKTSADVVLATSGELKANDPTKGCKSLFYMDSDGNITYAYTIRNKNIDESLTGSYGLQSIHLYLYDAVSGMANATVHEVISVIVSKPISDFQKESKINGSESDKVSDWGLTWLDENGETCAATAHTTAEGGVATDDICVEYINASTSTNETKTLYVELPKEVAYAHDVTEDEAANIPENTIYAINTFQNEGSSKYVKYYYYAFGWNDAKYSDKSPEDNSDLHEKYAYFLQLTIDARGSYHFYIEDLFGNTFSTESGGEDTDVDITDVSIRNLLIDYTNADLLTILDAKLTVTEDELFGGDVVGLSYTDPVKALYVNLQKDQVTVDLEVFSKILISEGVYYCGDGANADECGDDGDLEAIRKEALTSSEIQQTSMWKVPSNTLDGDKSIPEDVSRVTSITQSYVQGKSVINSGYNVNGVLNRLEYVISNNGRYRFAVTDKFGNSTNEIKTSADATETTPNNPYIDITVIDKTTPVITVGNGDSESVNSYDYVKGGGTGADNKINLTTDASNKTIYYNMAGSDRYFDYKDALTLIGKVSVVDDVLTTTTGNIFNYGLTFNKDSAGTYNDPNKGVASDRNSNGTATNLHQYILTNDLVSFTGGLVRPTESYNITSNKFTIGTTEYTITYNGDRPAKVSGGSTEATVTAYNADDDRTFTLNSKKYIISGNRVVSYGTDLVKVPVAGTGYTLTASDTYMFVDGGTYGETKSGSAVTFVGALDNPTYATKYVGFVEIYFYDAADGSAICVKNSSNADVCNLSEDADTNVKLFNEINKRIDTVRNFKMKFKVYDYVGHSIESSEILVEIVDNTSPGFLPEGGTGTGFLPQGKQSEDDESPNKWTNSFENSGCVLEVGNNIQKKSTLIDCYLLGAGVATNDDDVYYFIDNDTDYTVANAQWYGQTNYHTYYDSVKLEIETDTEGSFFELATESSTVRLDKARSHDLRITIYDNWDEVNSGTRNFLEVIVEFYVNPRTLLIEPIAEEKVYGQADPADNANYTYTGASGENIFDFCVYINRDSTTFYRIDEYFDLDFVSTYFKLAYCTRADIDGRTIANKGYEDITSITNTANILVNGNKFQGTLSRVESAWYNTNVTEAGNVHNNYVGLYNIVLGSLGIHPSTGTGSCSAESGGYDCGDDYVIKIKPDLLVNNENATSEGETKIKGKLQIHSVNQAVSSGSYIVNSVQTQNKELENDDPATESRVQFMIKQTIVTVTANGGTKTYGEQDSNSHNWNEIGTTKNSVSTTGYLGGYTVAGLVNDAGNYYYDTLENATYGNNFISGTLRRNAGENVGRYKICNRKTATPSVVDSDCDLTYTPVDPSAYDSSVKYNFAAYDLYGVGGTSETAALVVQTNVTIYGTVAGKGLNTDTRNYVIKYVAAEYTIKANELVVQPGINQGKEYSANAYYDPVWQLVVYGETVTCSAVHTCTSNIQTANTGFNGYTASIATNDYTDVTIDTYKVNGDKQKDTNAYYTRRKTSPNVVYTYQIEVNLTKSEGKYTNIYTKSNDYYYLEAKASAVGSYVYSHGTYHEITNANFSSDKVTISVAGHLVNQSYTLFLGADEQKGTATIARGGDHAVGWYTFNAITNATDDQYDASTFKIAKNGNEHCAVTTNSITVGSGDGYASECRDYNLTYHTSAPDKYEDNSNAEINEASDVLHEVITIASNTATEYKPDGLNSCAATTNNAYTTPCNANKTQVLFEIFKREIVISFDANNYIFVYGQRYDYYDGGNVTVNGDSANSKNGVFKIPQDVAYGSTGGEGNLFVCYNEYGIAVNCTANDDYGITAGDSWYAIGLEFYMHKLISHKDSAFYNSGSDYAIPAGTYYIYANISDAAKANYKFTYLGGTLTIVSKVTSIELTSYSMEYKDQTGAGSAAAYHSYGVGNDYSNYAEYPTRCMLDSNYTTDSNNLIAAANCATAALAASNNLGNQYGFTVEGLDSKDTIENNFVGRPKRESGDEVGYYKITPATIGSKIYAITSIEEDVTSCAVASFDNAKYADNAGCAMVTDSATVNYDISYSKTNNEGAYLFITPATITVTVEAEQTKMYGCAYDAFNTSQDYTYTVAGGYDHAILKNCNGEKTSAADDIAYKYTVTGDRDYGTRGGSYTITGDADLSNSTSLTGSLYRVPYTTDSISHEAVKDDSSGNVFQDQAVGNYIITIGDLNSKTVSYSTNAEPKTYCDEFNNPALNGNTVCRNYNVNYYGNSTNVDSAESDPLNAQHKYNDSTEAAISTLKTYDLNYVEDNDGEYVLMNGKYIKITQISSLTNYYVAISSLTKYTLYRDYELDNVNGTYVFINNREVVLSGGSEEIKDGYILLSSLQKYTSAGETSPSGEFIKISGKLIPVADVSKFAQKSGENKYKEDSNGKYVKINNAYVALDSLKKYKETDTNSGLYELDAANGTHVLVYGATSSNGLTKYKLDPANMYKEVTGSTGAYVYINGSYVLRSSLVANSIGSTEISYNSAMSAAGELTYASANVADSVQFEITHRGVHLHTEYNVKFVGNSDVAETITCSQIKASYSLSDYNGRTYCSNDATVITLGSARYYAIDNSLAKYPWTVWVDKANGITGVQTGKTAKDYNDTQFDVVTGVLSRKTESAQGSANDVVGKYTYDYGNITVTDLSGSNYIINIATNQSAGSSTDFGDKYSFAKTYVSSDGSGSVGTMKALSTFTRYNSSGEEDPLNGYYILIGTEKKSISLVPKYRKDNSSYVAISYWYLGFYVEDGSDGRMGELRKWWSDSSIFSKPYNDLLTLDAAGSNEKIHDPDLSEAREVYFEIRRRTIYLYAIDNNKVYGTPDAYDNFLVAVCATSNGYEIEDGVVKCKGEDSLPDNIKATNGLSDYHKGLFYNNDGSMKQTTIKGGSGYIFTGTDANSFKVYFKRTAGENVGVYSVTACATQTGITDCSDPSQEEQPGTKTEHIGDNYNIIEMAGTLTIETRLITVVPDGSEDVEDVSNQGFMYGNYPNNGAIPEITFKEYFGYGEDYQTQGAVNSGSSDKASAVATCLINISGESIVCINDNQNDEITATSYSIIGDYSSTVKTQYSTDEWKAKYIKYVNSIYKDSYSDPDNFESRSESDTRNALDRKCGSTDELRYSRDVCNYIITAGELSVDSTWVEVTVNEDVRIVASNRYSDSAGLTQDAEGNYLKVGSRMYEITNANRYTYSYVQADAGLYIDLESSESAGVKNKIKIVTANIYEAGCTVRINPSSLSGIDGKYYQADGYKCTQISSSIRYNLSKTLVQNNNGEFLRIGGSSDKAYNYKVEGFVDNIKYIVTEATVKVTPIADQFKIYGEKDPEIKFNEETTYTAKTDHLIPHDNVKTIGGNAATSLQKYDIDYTENNSGLYVKVEAGQVVVLNGFAYQENLGSSTEISNGTYNLNYGKNYTATKHAKTENTVAQPTTGATHFDAYTSYSSSNVTTSRILIGNFYVNNHDQNVGVREIMNGFIVAKNNLGNKNYKLDATNTVNTAISSIKFTIVPRPIYAEIQAITKEYGQATDILSCDNDVTCDAISSTILERYLAYNYNVATKTTAVNLAGTALNKTVGGGSANVYAVDNAGNANVAINLPNKISAAFASSDPYYSLTTVTTGKYYTPDGTEETKGGGEVTGSGTEYSAAENDLKIIVERGNYNVSRSGKACFVNGEDNVSYTGKGCEDVGQYYTNFKGIYGELPENAQTVETYYHGDYWGYNPNYYIIITNETDTAADTALNTGNVKDTQKKGSTLTINKKSIEIVVETFDDEDNKPRTYPVDYKTSYKLGEAYEIEENMDVPALPTVSNDATHTTYQKITWALHPSQVRTADQLFGHAAYCQSEITEKSSYATFEEAVQAASCTGGLIYYHTGDANANDANVGPNVFDTSDEGYYAITRDKDVLYIRYSDGETMNYSGADYSAYESNNYTTKFVNGILHVGNDETAPVIFAGTEYYAIEANNAALRDMNKVEDSDEENTYKFLNSIRGNYCATHTGVYVEGVVDYGDCVSEMFTTAIPVTGNKFNLLNNNYTISGNSITRTNGGGSSATIGANNKFTLDGQTYTVIYDSTTPVLITKEESNGISETTLATLIKWFNITSHDPSIVRAGANVGKRYDAKYYIAIDEKFNQRVVGDYTLFIYALDLAGNISGATTVTLRVQDTTKPQVGTLTLYDGKISCNYATGNCAVDQGHWSGTVINGWADNREGVWLNVTGGMDNTINYLNISGYKQFTVSGNTYTKVNSGGTHILFGNIILIDNMTKYYIQEKDGANYYMVVNPTELADEESTTYEGKELYVRYKGQYKKISDLTKYALSESTYTLSETGAYIFDGEFMDISAKKRYNENLQQANGGTYIKLDQWDHYFSRDNGATWIKYDREDVDGYLALGADGQRLIMIKAVDDGVSYSTAGSTNRIEASGTATGNKYFTGTYMKNDGTWTWANSDVASGSFVEYTVKTEVNNISDWDTRPGDNTADEYYYKDRKYAYLDTQSPILTLDDNGLWVFEYGCDTCINGYSEKYGNTNDSYMLELGQFLRYSKGGTEGSPTYTRNDSGMFVEIPNKGDNNATDAKKWLDITGRIYKQNTATSLAECTGIWVNSQSKCYVADISGDYVYLGTSVEENFTKDGDITTVLVDALKNTSVKVYVNDGEGPTSETANGIALATAAANSEQIRTSTIYNVSGMFGTNTMTGTQNTTQDIENVDHAHKKIIIYLAVKDPYTMTSSPTLTGGIFGNQTNSSTTYYKYELVCTGTTGSESCSVAATYSTASQTSITTTLSLSLGTFNSFDSAIYAIVTNSLEGKDYKGKDLTYSINYTVTDMAGNVSQTQVRGVIFSDFLETVRIDVGTGANVQSLYNEHSIDVDQNANAVSVLGNFKVTTTKSDANPLMDRNLIQTIYYNDQLIVENQKYDATTLSNLDTTVPGVYRVVYSTRRMDGDKVVYGNPFELTINIKPTVADVDSTIGYKQIALIAAVASSVLAILAYGIVINKKKKFN